MGRAGDAQPVVVAPSFARRPPFVPLDEVVDQPVGAEPFAHDAACLAAEKGHQADSGRLDRGSVERWEPCDEPEIGRLEVLAARRVDVDEVDVDEVAHRHPPRVEAEPFQEVSDPAPSGLPAAR